jgi:ABC-2 type transport system ATP-binding protein
MIDVENLVYEYPTKRALNGVTLSVRPHTITALVGPNGAGKTTLLRCLAALDSPYGGTVRIAGLDTSEAPREIHAQLGYLPDFFGLYDPLSVRRCLVFAARSHGLPSHEAALAAQRTAAQMGLSDRIGVPAAELSRGLRQRLAIGQAIVHTPKVLLLDEPAAGLDPSARRELSELLVSLKRSGMTLVVSSHILAELEDYCDEMIIMEEGRIVGGGALKVREEQQPLIRIELASPNGALNSFLRQQKGVEVLDATDGAAGFRFNGDAAARADLLRDLVRSGFDVISFAESSHQLQDAYFAEVKKRGASA